MSLSLPPLSDQQHVLLRAELLAHGFDDNAIARAVRAGELIRIRQGSYTTPDLWSHSTAEARYLMRIEAVVRRARCHPVVSHLLGRDRERSLG